MGLSKAYDELTDSPEFSDGLSISTGKGISDSLGQERLGIYSTGTFIRNPDGEATFETYNTSGTIITGYDSKPITIEDGQGGFDVVKYQTSSSAPGTLELTNANLDANGNDIENVGSVKTKQISNGWYYAGAYDGADADARLSNALADVANGDAIYLESAEYTADQTISKRIALYGTTGTDEGSEIAGTATLTLNEGVALHHITARSNDVTININDRECLISGLWGFDLTQVTVSTDDNRLIGLRSCDVTFESGTEGNIKSSYNRE